jgi:hypothetical protein
MSGAHSATRSKSAAAIDSSSITTSGRVTSIRSTAPAACATRRWLSLEALARLRRQARRPSPPPSRKGLVERSVLPSSGAR